jgi:hypothetical protein
METEDNLKDKFVQEGPVGHPLLGNDQEQRSALSHQHSANCASRNWLSAEC